ncbi:MAG: helix-turn-helix transcriptional regulator [Clostridiales bacterium]|nr:helix-turn-helix transcriptional regulator [Clostridiales bacterium]
MLGENIQKLRKSFSISQVEFAKALGVTKQCVSNWENSYIQPSLDMLVKIADYFKVSTDFLLGRTQNNPISTEGLSDKEIAHITLIVQDIINSKLK